MNVWNIVTIILVIAIISIAIVVITKQYENFTGIGKVFSFHTNPQPKCNPENNCFGGSYVKFGGNPNFKYDPRKRNFKMNLQ